MKRILVIGLAVVVLSSLVVFALPVLAHGSEDGEPSANQETWEAMHEACEEGDWEAMTEAAEEAHGDDFASMPCHDEGDYSPEEGETSTERWGGMGGNMGSGMMGGGWGGMM